MSHFKQEKSSLPPVQITGLSKDASGDSPVEVKSFQPRHLSGGVIHSYDQTKKKYGSLAVTDGVEKHFSLDPAAKKFLGVENEENRHLEGSIAEEVEKRIEAIRSKAYEDGFMRGKVDGEKLASDEFSKKSKPIYDHFVNVVSEFEACKEEIYHANEQFLIQLVFQVARQVTLQEVKTDKDYVKRLCDFLVEQVGAKDHVKIKIGKDDFAQVESIRDHLKEKFVDLKNIQIDVSDEFIEGGCKVETDLARINAGVDVQLQLINKALGEQ